MNFPQYSWGVGTITAELLLWYCSMLLWREMDSRQLLTLYFTLTQIFSGGKAKINLHMMLKLTIFMPPIYLMPPPCHLVFLMLWRLRTRHSERHSLNAWNVINWKRYFEENIIKKYLGERITKEVWSDDIASWSGITPCNNIDKTLVVYRFTGNVMMSKTMLRT